MSESNERTPRPRWVGLWWKVPLALVAGALLVGYVAHTLWLGAEKAKVDRQIAALRAAGEPVAWADLVEPAVPDEENLAVPIRAALAAFRPADATRGLYNGRANLLADDDRAFTLPLTEKEATHLREQARQLSPTLAALDGMAGRTGIAWGPVGTSNGGMTYDPDMSELTELGRLLRDDAALAIHERRWTDAVTRLEQVRDFSGAVARRASSNSAMFGLGEPDLAIDLAAAGPDAGVRDAIRAMIAERLDDAEVSRRFRISLQQTRVQLIESASMVRGGSFAGKSPPITVRVVLRAAAPLIYRSEAAALESLLAATGVADVRTAPDLDARGAGLRRIEAAAAADRFTISDALFAAAGSGERFEGLFDSLAERHLAAAALAIRLYANDHDDRRPQTLDALVPAYLPAVPIDPWNGKPIRYDATVGRLWSVARDRVDQGGDATSSSPYLHDRWWMRDGVVFLDPQPRPAPSTRPTTSPFQF